MTVDENGTKVFTIEGRNFKFSLKEIRVKKGDRVKIVFKNAGGFHDKLLKLNSSQIK